MFALLGVWKTIIRVKPRTDVAPEWAALAALAIATFILHCFLPVPIQSRFVVLLIPSVVLFSAAGINEIARPLSARAGLVLIFDSSLWHAELRPPATTDESWL
jgi:hypothetical protein